MDDIDDYSYGLVFLLSEMMSSFGGYRSFVLVYFSQQPAGSVSR